MLRNYLTVALRNLLRHRVFSLINILGLALGLACSLLILLWVRDERSVDAFHAHAPQLFSVYERQYYDGKVEAGHFTPGVLAEELKKVIPEIRYASGFAWENKATFAVGNKINKESGNHAGADYFRMFSYPLLRGTPETALANPTSIAISRKMAVNYFGSPEAAMGKTLRYEDRKDLMVTAVYENLPPTASSKFDYLINWQLFLEDNAWAKQWGNNGPHTLVMLRPDADPVRVATKIKRFLDAYNKDQSKSFRIELGLQRFDAMYLNGVFKNGQPDGGRVAYVRLFGLVAVFILLIACINFMNLATARSVQRAKEVGIRKVVGAVRALLVGQFLGEALLLTFFAVLVSLALIVLLLPGFNTLTGKQIALPFGTPAFWLSLLGLMIATGLVAGSYPALFLSSLNPIRVLKGTLRLGPGAGWFRRGLVIFQFVLSIALIIGTIVVSRQVEYAQTKNLGYDRANLVYLPLEGDLTGKYALFKQEVSRLPGIRLVSRISQTPTQIENNTGGVDWTGKDPNVSILFTQAAVGYDFVKTMNLKVLQGRDFSKAFATDSVSYLINEAAWQRIGYRDPINQPLTFWQKKGKIVGVVKDFHFNSFHEPIQPLILRLGETDDYGSALIRTEPGQTKEALASLEKLTKQLNPKFPFTYYFSDEEYQKLYQSEQVVGKLSNYFAFLAIFISCLGLLGLAAFTAEQRTKEIGVRKVLGASVGDIVALLSTDFLKLVLLANLIAWPLAWWATNRWLADFAYRTPIGWGVFALAGLAALLIALLTVSFQAIKAAVANPVKSLRTE
ncbi:MAG: ABC transporter permease [Ferruginibacter sp.]|nr:ABC transporter permease [Cytophagales bacterium]